MVDAGSRSSTRICLKLMPNGLTQKWSGCSGSRAVMCPATPSSKPRRPKIRKRRPGAACGAGARHRCSALQTGRWETRSQWRSWCALPFTTSDSARSRPQGCRWPALGQVAPGRGLVETIRPTAPRRTPPSFSAQRARRGTRRRTDRPSPCDRSVRRSTARIACAVEAAGQVDGDRGFGRRRRRGSRSARRR